MPPVRPSRKTMELVIWPPMKMMAGTVKMMAAARDSPMEAKAWTALFSRMVALRPKNLGRTMRRIVMEMMADGMEAETVMPILRPR